ncbi:hypothetical protein LguiB_001161 [Lonicera macranthoides]
MKAHLLMRTRALVRPDSVDGRGDLLVLRRDFLSLGILGKFFLNLISYMHQGLISVEVLSHSIGLCLDLHQGWLEDFGIEGVYYVRDSVRQLQDFAPVVHRCWQKLQEELGNRLSEWALMDCKCFIGNGLPYFTPVAKRQKGKEQKEGKRMREVLGCSCADCASLSLLNCFRKRGRPRKIIVDQTQEPAATVEEAIDVVEPEPSKKVKATNKQQQQQDDEKEEEDFTKATKEELERPLPKSEQKNQDQIIEQLRKEKGAMEIQRDYFAKETVKLHEEIFRLEKVLFKQKNQLEEMGYISDTDQPGPYLRIELTSPIPSSYSSSQEQMNDCESVSTNSSNPEYISQEANNNPKSTPEDFTNPFKISSSVVHPHTSGSPMFSLSSVQIPHDSKMIPDHLIFMYQKLVCRIRVSNRVTQQLRGISRDVQKLTQAPRGLGPGGVGVPGAARGRENYPVTIGIRAWLANQAMERCAVTQPSPVEREELDGGESQSKGEGHAL